jgi:hypothetical protein
MENILSLIDQGTKFTLAAPSGYYVIDADEARATVEDADGDVDYCWINDTSDVLVKVGDGTVCITIEFAK